MKTFKQFLTDEIHKKPESVEAELIEALHAVKTRCKKFYELSHQGIGIFRGYGSTTFEKPFLVDTVDSFRTSRDTNNMYQVMMEASSALKDIPARSHSLICSTTSDGAYWYAGSSTNICQVFPFDTANVIYSAVPDFIGSRVGGDLGDEITIKGFGSRMTALAKAAKRELGENENDAYHFASDRDGAVFLDETLLDHLLDTLDKDNFIRLCKYHLFGNVSNDLSNLVHKIASAKGRFSNLCSELLTPEALKLSTKHPESGSKECWFEGRAVVIPISML
jgi:hypothetical protein